jgi:single-strand DNA-binding protein
MASYNKVILAGNLCRDVEVRYLAKGTAVADISLAVNNSYTDKATGAKKDDVCYVDCTLWGRTAEIAGEHLRKGSGVLVDGRLSLDSRDDKATGTKRTKLKVVVENMQFLGGKDGGGESRRPAPTQERAPDFNPNDAFPVGGDEVPF